MMRLKHNKKRNTAFLFEVLTREYVKSIVKKNATKQKAIKNVIKEYFCSGALKEELSVYKEVLESKGLSEDQAKSVLQEAKSRYDLIDKHAVYTRQNSLIKEMKHKFTSDVFSNFVPNYKSIATVYNIFNNKTSIKEKMILEQRVVENLSSVEPAEEKKQIDNLTYKTFVSKFNDKYSNLPEEQKRILTSYIVSFSDNSLSLKNAMNEQITDLKSRMDVLETSSVLENDEMKEKFTQVKEKLESYKTKEIDDIMVTEVLMIQDLVRELTSDA